jgi:hypothetical protein
MIGFKETCQFFSLKIGGNRRKKFDKKEREKND